MNKVVEKIDKLRTEKNWTVYRLAEQSGVTQSAIHKWFDNDTMPTIPMLEQICDAFGITLSEFFKQGEHFELTAERKQLFDNWSKLTKAQKESLLAIMSQYIAN